MAENSRIAKLPQGNWFAAIPVMMPSEVLLPLQEHAPSCLRWFHAEDIHLTVAFFGRFAEDRLAAVLDVLKTVPSFSITATLGRLVPLPSPRRFSALSFELAQGTAEAAALMETYHLPLMTAAGVPPESRPAYPHITIARADRRASHAQRRAILNWCETVALPAVELTLSEIALYGWAEDRGRTQFRRLTASTFPRAPSQ